MNVNCTKMLSKTSMWPGNRQMKKKKKQVLFEKNHTMELSLCVCVGKHDHVLMAELWTTCQPVRGWQLSVCCALFIQHNMSERERDQDWNQTLYLWVYLPLSHSPVWAEGWKRSLHDCLFICLSSSLCFLTVAWDFMGLKKSLFELIVYF